MHEPLDYGWVALWVVIGNVMAIPVAAVVFWLWENASDAVEDVRWRMKRRADRKRAALITEPDQICPICCRAAGGNIPSGWCFSDCPVPLSVRQQSLKMQQPQGASDGDGRS